ncbi:MAG: DNA mismatch repair protein MutL, partial [Oscillospiraceae bacterium]|nr:DNA mismatch repair protein MutL [Oscillospiraceae bacterium]
INPLFAKNNRSFQNFFVNGRYVKSKSCATALESGYENLLMTGKFPACVLMLDMPADSLDVNIHPSKAEVRFSEEKKVIDAIYFAVKNAFLKNHLIYDFQTKKADWYGGAVQQEYVQKPLLSVPEKQPEIPVSASFEPLNQEDMPFQFEAPQTSDYLQKEPEEALPKAATVQDSYIDIEPEEEEFETEEINIPAVPEPVQPAERYQDPVFPPEREMFQNLQVIGELFANYIIAQAGENMILIDKHAAHERIIFARLRNQNCQQYQQQLLAPCQVLLTLEEFSVMEENPALLDRLGFQFDFSEKPYLKTLAAPIFFEQMNLEEIVQEIAHNLYLGKVNPQSHALDDTLHELACKSAIRANDKNSIPELQSLAEQVCQDENIRHCPHGRPVMFVMSKYQLEKQFKRRL